MNVRNPDITGPCRHLKTGAGYALNANISSTFTPPCFNRRGKFTKVVVLPFHRNLIDALRCGANGSLRYRSKFSQQGSLNPDIGMCVARATNTWPLQLSARELFGANGLTAMRS